MKKIILLFYFYIGFTYSQVKNKDSNFIEEEIQTCRIQINDTLSIYNLKYNLQENKVAIIVKTENTITKKCIDNDIKKDILNKIDANQNPIIKINNHLITGLNIKDFTNLIPNKLIAFEQNKKSIIVFELYSFSYTTVGNSYIYECFKLDKTGNVIAKKMIERKLPMRKKDYYKVF